MNNNENPNNVQPSLNTAPPTKVPLPNVQNLNNEHYQTLIKSKLKGDIVIENHGLFNSREELLRAFNDIQKNPVEREKFNKLSKQDQEQYLINIVINKYRLTHELKGPHKQKKQNPNLINTATEAIANNKENDVKINSDLGIIKDNTTGTITTIEQQKDNSLRITETNDVGMRETVNINNLQQHSDIYQNKDPRYFSQYPETPIETQYNTNTYLSEQGIENPNNKFREEQTPSRTSSLAQANVRKRVLKRNNQNFSNKGFVTTKMMITVIISFPLALFVGLLVGTILGTN